MSARACGEHSEFHERTLVQCFDRAVSNSTPLTSRRRISVGGDPPAPSYAHGLCLPEARLKTLQALMPLSAQLLRVTFILEPWELTLL